MAGSGGASCGTPKSAQDVGASLSTLFNSSRRALALSIAAWAEALSSACCAGVRRSCRNSTALGCGVK